MSLFKTSPKEGNARRLQTAFDLFKSELFDNKLPQAMLLIKRLKNANGIYRPSKYTDKQGSTAPE